MESVKLENIWIYYIIFLISITWWNILLLLKSNIFTVTLIILSRLKCICLMIKFNFLFDFIHQNTLTWSFNLPACAAENEILKIWLEHVYQ